MRIHTCLVFFLAHLVAAGAAQDCNCDAVVSASVKAAKIDADTQIDELSRKLSLAQQATSKCNTDLQSKVESGAADQKSLEEKIAALEKEKSDLKAKVGSIQQLQTDLNKANKELESHKSLLATTKEELTTEVESHKDMLNKATSMVKQHQEELSNTKKDLDDVRAKSRTTYVNFAQIKEDVVGLVSKVTKKKETAEL